MSMLHCNYTGCYNHLPICNPFSPSHVAYCSYSNLPRHTSDHVQTQQLGIQVVHWGSKGLMLMGARNESEWVKCTGGWKGLWQTGQNATFKFHRLSTTKAKENILWVICDFYASTIWPQSIFICFLIIANVHDFWAIPEYEYFPLHVPAFAHQTLS